MKIFIAGDSFATDWSIKYPTMQGWPNMLAGIHTVTNVAEAGCGEYKILKQLTSHALSDYDAIIVSHTSPYRIHTTFHPIHSKDKLHYNSDFIYEDCKAHKLKFMTEYFEKCYDLDYAKYVHTQICKDIDLATNINKVIHITHSTWQELWQFPKLLNFEGLAQLEPGNANHYSTSGNQLVFDTLNDRLANM